MRLQWCRDHIDEVKEACALSNDAVIEIKKVNKFVEEYPDFAVLPTRVIRTVFRVRDDPVREKVISSVLKSLKSGKHPITGEFLKNKRLTERDVKKVIGAAGVEYNEKTRAKQPGITKTNVTVTPREPTVTKVDVIVEQPVKASEPNVTPDNYVSIRVPPKTIKLLNKFMEEYLDTHLPIEKAEDFPNIKPYAYIGDAVRDIVEYHRYDKISLNDNQKKVIGLQKKIEELTKKNKKLETEIQKLDQVKENHKSVKVQKKRMQKPTPAPTKVPAATTTSAPASPIIEWVPDKNGIPTLNVSYTKAENEVVG